MKRGKTDLRYYFRWPFILGGLLAVLAIVMLFVNTNAGIVLAIAAAVFLLAALILYLVLRKKIEKDLIAYGENFSEAQRELINNIDLPFVITNQSGDILRPSVAFQKQFLQKKKVKMLSNLFPGLENADFDEDSLLEVENEGRTYDFHITPFPEETAEQLSDLSDLKGTGLYIGYLTDKTDLLYYQKTLEDERPIVAVIYFDNYEEVLADVENIRRSLLSALLERKLSQYIGEYHGIIRKLEKDRFIAVFRNAALESMKASNFSILSEIKTVNIGNNIPVTLSIGVGLSGGNYEKNYDYARMAIDMALGRGGDQVVVKDGSKISYFGGQAKSTERSTRVKARIKAQALRELIEARDDVIIMGHPISDLDCIGAAMGIYRVAASSGKEVHIVLDEVTSSVKPLLQTFTTNTDYNADLFVDPETALSMAGKNTLLVVVDTNRPSYTVCPDLLKRISSVVVMDHHRQGREIIENAMLSYVEPFASSTAEMVAEVVQYYGENMRLKPAEADAVLAGIVMDTNNFEDKAGVRTFEAAAYLRRCGADVTRVRKLFRDTMEDYVLRAETVRRAEVFEKYFVISVCPTQGANPNQTVVAAQAANELLEIRDIKASFVLTEFENKIYLSARSIDEVNVQVMMEKLGGGGHRSVAGVQFTGITMDEAVEKLKAVILEETGAKKTEA
ncbi:MAG: DHH family phosphoesterase [Lachnospiraceae bacterium]|nr:DHH family phosphoesterase [Lachnospiraceae bacterium]